MGTRGLTAVQVGGEYVVAQYGQWDHYPSGQGATALEFCAKHLAAPTGREEFKRKLAQVKFSASESELESSTFERTNPRGQKETYYYCGRDNGAEILELIWDAPEGRTIYLNNSIDFSGDSLFCEYAYVVDLDANTLEVFRGFNKGSLAADERFAKYFHREEHRGADQYQPVRHLKTYTLGKLPTKSVFLEELEPKDDEE